jgi:hypothetical protein
MSQYYLDSSAAVKLYVAETGLPPLTFVGADTRLNEAALAEGLVVLDLNQPSSS